MIKNYDKNKLNCLMIGASSKFGLFLSQDLVNYNLIGTSKNKNKLNFLEYQFFLDLNSDKSINKFINNITSYHMKYDLVLFLAGLKPNKSRLKNSFLSGLRYSEFNSYLKINCFSNVLILENLIKNNLLNISAKIIFFSSAAGSIEQRGKLTHHKTRGDLLYRISKSAINCAVKNISYDLNKKNFITLSIHPGYAINTNDYNLYSKKIKKLIDNISQSDNGKFIDPNKNNIPW